MSTTPANAWDGDGAVPACLQPWGSFFDCYDDVNEKHT